ncbi:MAG: IS1634 family transposase [Oligoflexia bacterium]|nr:IS1634 family transposase [Oligoflexia bacterium]
MFIKVTKKPNGSSFVRVMESVRHQDKVIQKTLHCVGSSKTQEGIRALEKVAGEILVKLSNERQPVLPGMEKIIYSKEPEYVNKKSESKLKKKKKTKPLSIFSLKSPREKERVHYGIKGVCGAVYEQLKFHTIIEGTRKDEQWNDILKCCVLSRIAHPDSKRKTVETLREDYNETVPLEKMYRMMDRLHPNIAKVKDLVAKNTLSLFNQEVDVLFFDVTTLYFESFDEDDIRQFGFSKDLKFNQTQVVLALVTNQEGHPLSYELFPGRTSEGNTLITVIKKLKQRFTVNKAVIVADRAMFNEQNLKLMEEEGLQYVVAAKIKSLPKAKREEILSEEYRQEASVAQEFQWVKELEHKQRRLIVSYSQRRAKKSKSDRQKLIDRLMKKVKNNRIPIKSLISNYGTKKYITVERTKARLNEQKIEEDSRWDGLHGVITNIDNQSAHQLLTRYRQLWKIEEAFRVCKHSLKMRPVYHWKKKRIEAHIAICFLAYSLSYTMKHRMEQRGLKFSLQKMREVLKRDQYSLIEDAHKKLYRMPSKYSEPIKQIYEAFNLKRVSHITPVS